MGERNCLEEIYFKRQNFENYENLSLILKNSIQLKFPHLFHEFLQFGPLVAFIVKVKINVEISIKITNICNVKLANIIFFLRKNDKITTPSFLSMGSFSD